MQNWENEGGAIGELVDEVVEPLEEEQDGLGNLENALDDNASNQEVELTTEETTDVADEDLAGIENKANHIFNNPEHDLGDLADAFDGDTTAATQALQQAGQEAVQAQNIQGGVQTLSVTVQGVTVTVRGIVVNGIFALGTAW